MSKKILEHLKVVLTSLTPKEIKTFRKLSDLTSGKCQQCPSMGHVEKEAVHRCCDKMFCELVEEQLKDKGLEYPKPNVAGIPYMSDQGCVVAPHDRPQCTGYVCREHIGDDEFYREYQFLCNRLGIASVRRAQ